MVKSLKRSSLRNRNHSSANHSFVTAIPVRQSESLLCADKQGYTLVDGKVSYYFSTKHCTVTKSPSLSERLDRDTRPGYCQHPERSQSTKSRRVEYIKIAQRSSQRLTAREMALGFKDKHVLIGQVEEYNRRIQLPTFHIKGNFTSDVSFCNGHIAIYCLQWVILYCIIRVQVPTVH